MLYLDCEKILIIVVLGGTRKNEGSITAPSFFYYICQYIDKELDKYFFL